MKVKLIVAVEDKQIILVGCDIVGVGKSYCRDCFWRNKTFMDTSCIGKEEFKKIKTRSDQNEGSSLS